MTLAVTWPEQILSTHPGPMICNDNYGSQQVYRDVPSIFSPLAGPGYFTDQSPARQVSHIYTGLCDALVYVW